MRMGGEGGFTKSADQHGNKVPCSFSDDLRAVDEGEEEEDGGEDGARGDRGGVVIEDVSFVLWFCHVCCLLVSMSVVFTSVGWGGEEVLSIRTEDPQMFRHPGARY